MRPSLLSNTSSTEAVPTGLRAPEPLNTTSAMLSPRRCLADSSPITQRTASITFDLPQPFGPTTPVRLLGKLIWVGSTKDLKPASLILVSRISYYFRPCVQVWRRWCSVDEYADSAHP